MSMRAAAKFRHPINGQGRMTGNPEVSSSPVGLVPTNALVLTELVKSRMVGNPEVILRPDLFGGQVVNALFILRRVIGN
jgi:hypothetical protein